MNQRIEGTVTFDGLLEGKLLDEQQVTVVLRRWVRRAVEAGLPLSLEIEGGSFNVLALNRAVPVAALGRDPADAMTDALEALLGELTPPQRTGIFSTLRSTEIRPGQEVQTLYVIGAGGTVDARHRTVEARTAAGERPLTRKEKVRVGAAGLLVAVCLFLVSSVFVDYRGLVRRVIEGITPFRVEDVTVQTGLFAEYFTIARSEALGGGQAIALTLKRTKAFPKSQADLKRLLTAAGDSPDRLLAAQALGRGYVRCECYDKEGKFLAFSMHRIAGLRTEETTTIAVPVPHDPRPARVNITY